MPTKQQHLIYVVEDNFMYSYLLESLLAEQDDFKIITFSNADECLQMLKNNPDVIILDYNLDGSMNGLEALKHIKKTLPKANVIMLSGQNKPEIAAECLKNGAFNYIEKKDKEKAMEQLSTDINALLNL